MDDALAGKPGLATPGAWGEHVDKLTPEQRQDPQVLRAHLARFPVEDVSRALGGTALEGKDDVLGHIAKFADSPQGAIMPAVSGKMLSDAVRERHLCVMLQEIDQVVMSAARDGRNRTKWLDPREDGTRNYPFVADKD